MHNKTFCKRRLNFQQLEGEEDHAKAFTSVCHLDSEYTGKQWIAFPILCPKGILVLGLKSSPGPFIWITNIYCIHIAHSHDNLNLLMQIKIDIFFLRLNPIPGFVITSLCLLLSKGHVWLAGISFGLFPAECPMVSSAKFVIIIEDKYKAAPPCPLSLRLKCKWLPAEHQDTTDHHSL